VKEREEDEGEGGGWRRIKEDQGQSLGVEEQNQSTENSLLSRKPWSKFIIQIPVAPIVRRRKMREMTPKSVRVLRAEA
jgi:hypothetical protein